MIGYIKRELAAFKNIRDQLGDNYHPNWTACLIDLRRLEITALPRTFFWVNDFKTNTIPFQYGLDTEMGYPYTKNWTEKMLLSTIHLNQRLLLIKQRIALYQLMLKYASDFNRGIYYFGGKRAFKDYKGNYWLVAQSSKVLQWDENNKAITIFNWFHILGTYKGEPLTMEIFANQQNKKRPISNIKIIQQEFNQLKVPTLLELGFTPKQQQVITLIAIGIAKKLDASNLKKRVATNMKISERSVSGHRAKILKIGKSIFPLNTFETAVDVIRYLIAQDIIH